MTDEKPTIPKPEPDGDSQPYWDGLRQHKLLVQQCGHCGEAQLYFRAICKQCWSRDLKAVECSGDGTVYSYTVVHTVGEPALQPELPYALAIVALNEGPRVMTRIEGDPGEVNIGDPVVATYRDIAGDATLLYFRRPDQDPVAWQR